MKGIFISHSTQNGDLVEHVVELLQSGMGIGRERIFCTSLNGALPTGRDFVSIIKENMRECEMVIALITREYLESAFCMMELGAAWVQTDYLCPILAGNVDYKDLAETPLKSIQMRKLGNENDFFAIFDEMSKREIITFRDTMQFNKKLKEFMKDIVKYSSEGRGLICPDLDGYYEAKVEKVRKVPELYRCYKIMGNLDLKDNGIEKMEETHWIFFKAGVYDDLKEGDVIRLKVGKTERRKFSDIGWARNIYPDELLVVEKE
ncbi:MAG: toll/interleukin-1 receptor domain-containing protein [Roseburia sp.]|nr:toll/interleukin-1 receptor domain-containing protein [Roseburia sp.]MCM1277567.1 toll/interleukin-1 receptor domain-containing protein [Robinsoniella sp.]